MQGTEHVKQGEIWCTASGTKEATVRGEAAAHLQPIHVDQVLAAPVAIREGLEPSLGSVFHILCHTSSKLHCNLSTVRERNTVNKLSAHQTERTSSVELVQQQSDNAVQKQLDRFLKADPASMGKGGLFGQKTAMHFCCARPLEPLVKYVNLYLRKLSVAILQGTRF